MRAFPWQYMQFHGRNCSDWIIFIPPWCSQPAGSLDMNNPDHFVKLSYGRLIVTFKCRVAPDLRRHQNTKEKSLAFVEELWEYTPGEVKDVFRTDFGCKRLYRTQPKPTYYVVDVWRVIGDAPIVTDPVTPRIPCGTVLRGTGAGGITRNPMAKADSSRTKTDGSALFIVNKWGFKRSRTLSGSHRTQIIMHTCATCWDACLILVREHMCARSCLQCRWECSPRLRASRRFKSG